MMVGHSAIAFSITAYFAWKIWDIPREHALALGMIAGLFAVTPDTDIAHSVFVVISSGLSGFWGTVNTFWATTSTSHRTITHSFIVSGGVIISAIVYLYGETNESSLMRIIGVVLVVGCASIIFLYSSLVGFFITLLYGLSVIAVVYAALIYTEASSRQLVAIMMTSILFHPLEDVLTGTPPQFFFPLTDVTLQQRIMIFPDPTTNLIAVFLIEVATVWMVIIAYLVMSDFQLSRRIFLGGGVGAGYAIAVPFVQPPTMNVSYPFVFTVLGIGVLGVVVHYARTLLIEDNSTHKLIGAGLTGLVTVTVASLVYLTAYIA